MTGARGLILAIATCVTAVAATTSRAASYYVGSEGSDFSSGLWVASPFRTIRKAMDTAVAGDTVFVRGGVYREQVDVYRGGGVAGKPVRVQNYNGEQVFIKGSDVVTGWTLHSGSIWKKAGWTTNSQQVFVDFNDANPAAGPKPLQQVGVPSAFYSSWEYPTPVGSGVDSMVAGSFHYDAAATTLYVWLADGSDPNEHLVEASVRRRLFFMGKPWIVLDGLKFRHSNVSAFVQQGAAVELSSYSVMTRCDVQFTDFSGVSTGYLQSNSQVTSSVVSNNGAVGVTMPGTSNFRIAGNIINSNNTRNFNPLWHTGGVKGATKAWGNVEYNQIAGNGGPAIWFDHANGGQPIVVRFNYVLGNGPKEAAIFFEVSTNGLIHNNVVANNTRRGIYLSGSSNTRVLNNTVVGTGGRAGIDLGGMPREGATLANNQVVNNIISHGTTVYDLLITPANGTTIQGNTSDYNLIHRADGIRLWSGRTYADLPGWRTATGQDTNSRSADPMFFPATNPPGATNYKLRAGSPAIDTGLNLLGVYSRDYLGALRPTGAGFDIGAFEAK